MSKINPENSLSVLLIATAALVIFSPLCAVGLLEDEQELLHLAKTNFGISNADFASAAYAAAIRFFHSTLHLPDTLAVRLPGAIAVWLLSFGVFKFRGDNEKRKYAFLASLIFLSSYPISAIAYHAYSLIIPAFFLIGALMLLFRLLENPSFSRYLLLFILAGTCAIFFLKIYAILLFAASILIFTKKEKRAATLPKCLISLATAFLISFSAWAALTQSIGNATQILFESAWLTEPFADASRLSATTVWLTLSFFPWSIPIIVALGWIVCHPRWIKNKFLAADRFRKFGIFMLAIFILLCANFNNISFILLIAAIFFNASAVSHFLLSQIHNHSVTWRMSGGIFGVFIGTFALLYIAVISGVSFSMFGYAMQPNPDWNVGTILLLVAIATGLYSLSRNYRTIRFRDRYLYDIVILYLLSQIFYKIYINPYLITP